MFDRIDPFERAMQLERNMPAEKPLPSGRARCVSCGRTDLLSASTTDGRRIVLEAAPDDGDWAIAGDLAQIVGPGGDLKAHKCRGVVSHDRPE